MNTLNTKKDERIISCGRITYNDANENFILHDGEDIYVSVPSSGIAPDYLKNADAIADLFGVFTDHARIETEDDYMYVFHLVLDRKLAN